ncbi:MAG TPA: hypothetical protein VEI97_18455, partial [bacterium]|nr:hypothetical protein [bacterium]
MTRPPQPWPLVAVLLGALLLVGASPALLAGEEDAPELFDLAEVEAHALPWNEGILATTFCEHGTAVSGLGHHLNGQEGLFVALPAITDTLPCLEGRMMRRDRTAGTISCRVLELRPHGKEGPVVEATVEDIGPWCTDDPYWVTGDRPAAEDGVDKKGRKTNGAGIDVSPA